MELIFKDTQRIEIRNKFSEEVVCVMEDGNIKASAGYMLVVYRKQDEVRGNDADISRL